MVLDHTRPRKTDLDTVLVTFVPRQRFTLPTTDYEYVSNEDYITRYWGGGAHDHRTFLATQPAHRPLDSRPDPERFYTTCNIPDCVTCNLASSQQGTAQATSSTGPSTGNPIPHSGASSTYSATATSNWPLQPQAAPTVQQPQAAPTVQQPQVPPKQIPPTTIPGTGPPITTDPPTINTIHTPQHTNSTPTYSNNSNTPPLPPLHPHPTPHNSRPLPPPPDNSHPLPPPPDNSHPLPERNNKTPTNPPISRYQALYRAGKLEIPSPDPRTHYYPLHAKRPAFVSDLVWSTRGMESDEFQRRMQKMIGETMDIMKQGMYRLKA